LTLQLKENGGKDGSFKRTPTVKSSVTTVRHSPRLDLDSQRKTTKEIPEKDELDDFESAVVPH